MAMSRTRAASCWPHVLLSWLISSSCGLLKGSSDGMMRQPIPLKKQSHAARPANTANYHVSATVPSPCFRPMTLTTCVTSEIWNLGMAASCLIF